MHFSDIDTYHALVSPPVSYNGRAPQATPKPESPLGRNLASQFIESNVDILEGINSFAKALIAVPKFIFGTLPLKLSKSIQGGHDAQANSLDGRFRYLLSFPPWLVGTLGEATFELIGSAVVDVPLHLLKRLGEFAVSVVSIDGNSIDKQAKKTVSNPLLSTASTNLPDNKKADMLSYAKLGRASQNGQTYSRTESTTKATEDHIPKSILAKREDNPEDKYGTKLALRIDDKSNKGVLLLRSGSWSALRVGVFQQNGKFILCFDGTGKSRPGTFKSDIASFFGLYDSAHRDGKKLVKAFVEQYGPHNVVVTGHSLGASIGSYAAISNSTENAAIFGVFFNGLGLHPSLYQKLGGRVQFASYLTNVHTQGDWLTAYQPFTSPGLNYAIPDSEQYGHKLEEVVSALEPKETEAG